VVAVGVIAVLFVPGAVDRCEFALPLQRFVGRRLVDAATACRGSLEIIVLVGALADGILSRE